MKRLLTSSLLVYALSASPVSLATMPEIRIPTEDGANALVSKETAQAYHSILEAYQTLLGTSDGSNQGLAYGRLVDFDQDGTQELYLLYVQGIYETDEQGLISTTEVVEEVWRMENGVAINAHTAIERGNLLEGEVGMFVRKHELLFGEEGVYLLVNNQDTATTTEENTFKLYGFNGSSFELQEDLFYSQNDSQQTSLAHHNGAVVDAPDLQGLIEHTITDPYDIGETVVTFSSTRGDSLAWVTDVDCIEEMANLSTDAPQDYFGYPWVSDPQLMATIEGDVPEKLGGEILAVFGLSEELFYTVVDVNGTQQSHIVYKGSKNANPYYGILYSEPANMEMETLWEQISLFQNSSNLIVNYSPLAGMVNQEDFVQYLDTMLGNVVGLSINQHAKREIALFVQVVLMQMGTVNNFANDNLLVVTGDDLTGAIGRIQSQEAMMLPILEKHNCVPNSTIQKTVQVVANGFDKSDSMQITVDESVLDQLEPGMNLKVQVAASQYALEFTQESLVELLDGEDYFTVLLAELSENHHAVHFFTAQGDKIDRIMAPVLVTLPANSVHDSVTVSYTGGQDNWGGQWDELNQSITISTSYTGEYGIVDRDITMTDIDHLPQVQQEAIEFMVSKGFFSQYEGEFSPEDPLSRNVFSVALVGMFYALDRDLEVDFVDVPTDSYYHDFVASAQAKNLISGFEGNYFRGNANITQEQVLVIIARTLVEEKGYTYPEDLDVYLNFSGGPQVSEWAQEAVALCFREGIILRGEFITPEAEVSRGQAALHLQRLFMLLYDVSPVSVTLRETQATPVVTTEEIALATAGVFITWTALLSVFSGGKNRKAKKQAVKEAKQALKEAKKAKWKG